MRINTPLTLLIFLIHAIPGLLPGQIPLKIYTTATDTCYWKRYEHIRKPQKFNLKKVRQAANNQWIDSFITEYNSFFPSSGSDSTRPVTTGEVRKYLFPVEISGDGLTDMIYSGYGGGEEDMVKIFLNRGDHFDLVFEDYQYITKYRKTNGMLTELQTGDPGGHEDYLYFIRDYRVEYNHDGPAFVKVRQTVAYRFTEEPAVYLKTPGGFRSKADTLMVRASAAMINEPFIPDLGTFGNIIAKYRSRCRGDILAVKSYGKGNDWYYVEIYPDAVPSASILYNTDRMPTFLRGWVSGLAIVIAEK